MKTAKKILSIICAPVALLVVIEVFLPLIVVEQNSYYSSATYSANALSFSPVLSVAILIFGVLSGILLLEKTKHYAHACMCVAFILNAALINVINATVDLDSSISLESGHSYIVFMAVLTGAVSISYLIVNIIELVLKLQLTKDDEKPNENKHNVMAPPPTKSNNVTLLETRLEYLTTLREKGTLTEEEYAEKRKGVIDSFNF